MWQRCRSVDLTLIFFFFTFFIQVRGRITSWHRKTDAFLLLIFCFLFLYLGAWTQDELASKGPILYYYLTTPLKHRHLTTYFTTGAWTKDELASKDRYLREDRELLDMLAQVFRV